MPLGYGVRPRKAGGCWITLIPLYPRNAPMRTVGTVVGDTIRINPKEQNRWNCAVAGQEWAGHGTTDEIDTYRMVRILMGKAGMI